ncbi:MAG: DUF4833 domain-containing protein [Bacteroidales bacterium]
MHLFLFTILLAIFSQFAVPETPGKDTDLGQRYFKTKLLKNVKDELPVYTPQDILFVVSHQESPNLVIYQANRKNGQGLDSEKPVDVFWLMNSRGKTTENLTMIEWKLAYGFKLITIEKGKKYKIAINALKDKIISIVQNQNGKVDGFMNLKGINCKLKNVYIAYEETLYIPNVQYIDLSGVDPVSGKNITERVFPD